MRSEEAEVRPESWRVFSALIAIVIWGAVAGIAGAQGGSGIDPSSGFTAQLAGEGIADVAAPECHVSGEELICLYVTPGAVGGRECEFGGSVPGVRMAAGGPPREQSLCVDEGFHDWPPLRLGESFTRDGFECEVFPEGEGIGAQAKLRCGSRSGSFVVSPGGQVEIEEGGQKASWLVLGDSYTSGEGIPGTTPDKDLNGFYYHGRDCNRATGENTDATAWAIEARRMLSDDFDRPTFVPCTGATTDEAPEQISEAGDKAGRNSWDLVTLGFGGNNLGFSDVLQDCIDAPTSWGGFNSVGCGVTEGELRDRVDKLVSTSGPTFKGSTSLPELFSIVASRTRNGGDVIVTGYPQLAEEVSRWDRWRKIFGACEGLHDFDVGMLRSVTGYLNEQIALSVQAADQRYRKRGIRFHFADIANDPYEFSDEPGSRHGLCSADPWLNGIRTGISDGDIQFERSFHPTQTGHTNTGRVIASLIRDQVALDDRVAPLEGPLRFDGLGLVRMGMTIEEIERQGVEMGELEGIGVCASPIENPNGIFFGFGADGRLNFIGNSMDSSTIATEDRIRVGDSVKSLKAAYEDRLRFVGLDDGVADESGQGTDFVVEAADGSARIEFWTLEGRVVGVYAAGGPFEVPTEEWCS